tara:strand:- start:7415 stop:7984 length:570 start_codon:yes stop_codon:yes gene_type:complete
MKKITNVKLLPSIDDSLWFKLVHASALKFTYLDMVHFFGEPKVYDEPKFTICGLNKDGVEECREYNRRLEWVLGEFDNKGKLKLDDNGNPIVCTIYDSDSKLSVEDNFIWYVDALVSRGFEIVGEYIINERQNGKNFVSKELPKNIVKEDEDEMLKVEMTPEKKKIMKELKKKNDKAKAKKKNDKTKSK